MNNHKLEILLLLAVLLIAFGTYSIPSQTYPNINEFDPFYHARVARELIKTGTIPEWEFMSYWPEGMAMNDLYPHLWHYVLAATYWAVALLTTGSLAYSEPLFIKAVSWLMPFVGAFGVASMYLLGKEIRNKKAGLIAAVLFAFQSNFLYKTMYAEIEEDAFGIGLLVFSLFAYVYALKRGGWKNALFAGLAMTALVLAWRGAVYAAFLIAGIAIWQGIKAIMNKKWGELEKTAETMLISIVPVALLGLPFNPLVQDVIYVLGMLGGTAALLVIANYWFSYHKAGTKAKMFNVDKKKVYQGLAAVMLLGTVVAGVVYGGPILAQTLYGLNIGKDSIRLYYTVAEQHTVGFGTVLGPMSLFTVMAVAGAFYTLYFFLKNKFDWAKKIGELGENKAALWLIAIINLVVFYGISVTGMTSGLGLLTYFGMIAAVYFPVRGLTRWKEMKNFDLLVGVFMATSIIMYMGQNKLHYFFGPVAMLAIGIVLADILKFSGKLDKWAKRVAILGVFVLLLSSVTIGFAQMEELKVQYPIQDGWFKTMDWLETTPEDTAFLTWWDYGHWTAFLGNRHAIVDNTNINNTKVETVADIFTEYRANNSEELAERVLPKLKAFKVTHVGVDRILLTNKWGALTYIADRQCIPTKSLAANGLTFPQLSEMSKSACGYGYTYSGEIGIAGCQKKTISSEFGDESYVGCNFIQGSEVQFTEQEWDEIKTTTWPGYPLTITSPDGGSLTMRVYGQPDNTIMFFHANNKLLFDAPVNYMYGFRVFFQDPGLKHHELVINEWVPNEEVVVQKVVY
ncbi:STT3 domain-containing protein [archaeon]